MSFLPCIFSGTRPLMRHTCLPTNRISPFAVGGEMTIRGSSLGLVCFGASFRPLVQGRIGCCTRKKEHTGEKVGAVREAG